MRKTSNLWVSVRKLLQVLQVKLSGNDTIVLYL